jgi:hypothetical protein
VTIEIFKDCVEAVFVVPVEALIRTKEVRRGLLEQEVTFKACKMTIETNEVAFKAFEVIL